MVVQNLPSKRRPYPYDARVKDVWVTLMPQEDGNLVSKKSKTLEATAPTNYTYSASSPFRERTVPFRELYGGMGLAVEPNQGEFIRRYSYTTRCDMSVDGKWMKGPKFETHIETIHASAGAVRQLIIALHGGSERLFAICDNGVWRRTADNTWVASLTSGTSPALPGGQIPRKAERYKALHSGATDNIYLGTDDGNLWEYNGAAWEQATATEGPGHAADNGEARYVAKIGDELWIAGNTWVIKNVDGADPMLRASWADVIHIGDASSTISWIENLNNTLMIYKTNGRVYSVTADGEDIDLFPSLQTLTSLNNGRNSVVWKDEIWSPIGDNLSRIDASFNLKLDGLELLLDNSSPIRGRFAAGAAHGLWFMYEIYYNEITNTSHLIKHGGWVGDPESDVTNGQDRYIEVHHGSLAQWAKEATSAAVISGVHATSNDRLYVGFSDGTVEWCVLPRATRDPSADTACEFTGLDSYVYLPEHHAKFQADNKLWQGVTVFGSHISTTEFVQVEYRLFRSTLASWEVLTDEDGDTDFTLSGQRLDFPISPPVYSRQIEFRIKLLKHADLSESPANQTPIIDGIGVHESVRPSLSLEYTADIHCSSYRPLRDGRVDRRRGQAIRQALLDVAAEIGNIEIMLPDGTVEEVAVLDIQDSWKSQQKRRDMEYTLRMVFIQVRTITQNLNIQGITYDVLEQYTLEELEDII